jgi:hypothetical protein
MEDRLMKIRTKLSILLIVIMTLAMVGTVAAQEGTDPTATTSTTEACDLTADTTGWTIVEYDGETAWVLTAAGELCTVSITGEGAATSDHPITQLLAEYLAKAQDGDLTNTLSENEVCALFTAGATPEEDTWEVVPCDTADAVRVVGTMEDGTLILLVENEDGTFEIMDSTDPVDTTMFADFWADLTKSLEEANAALPIGLIVNEDGEVVDATAIIMGLRDQGLGYGVIVKMISMSEEFGVDLDQLVQEFKEEHVGIGQLFKEHGKPSKLGVGHIRKAMNDQDDSESTEPSTTVGPGRGQGQSNKPDTPPGLEKKENNTQTNDFQGKGNSGKSNNGKGNGKGKGKP